MKAAPKSKEKAEETKEESTVESKSDLETYTEKSMAITGLRQLKGKFSSPDFLSSIKISRFRNLMLTGNITLEDVKGADTIRTRKIFDTVGIWSPDDAYELFNDGHFSILKAIGTKYGKGITLDTVVNTIFVAPTTPPDFTKDFIQGSISGAIEMPEETFENRRLEEIKHYLRYFGAGKGDKVPITLQVPGVGVTVEKAKIVIEEETDEPAFLESPSISRKDAETLLKSYIEKNALKNAMIATDTKIMAKNALRSTSLGKEILRDHFGVTTVEEVQKLLDDTIQKMLEEQELIYHPAHTSSKDPRYIMPNNYIMTKKLLGSNAVYIGKTRNPYIFYTGEELEERPEGEKGLIFSKGKEASAVIHGRMIVEDEKDLDYAAKILGVSPKTGFAPLMFDWRTNQIAENLLNFRVYVRPPMRLLTKKIRAESIQKSGSNFTIEMDMDKGFDPFARLHMWLPPIADDGEFLTKDEIKKEVDDVIDTFKPELRGKRLRDLPDEEFTDLFAAMNDYGGTMCNWRAYGQNKIAINDIWMLSDLKFLENVAERYYKTKSSDLAAILKNISESKALLESKIKRSIEKGASYGDFYDLLEKKGTMEIDDIINQSTTPKCQKIDVIPSEKAKNIVKFTIPSGTPIYDYLSIASNYCVVHSEIEQCLEKTISFTQNITEQYLGTSSDPVFPISDKVLEFIANDYEFDSSLNQIIGEIAREKRTGQKTLTADGSRKLYVREKVHYMDMAKLGDSIPLKVDQWKFIEKIKGKSFAPK